MHCGKDNHNNIYHLSLCILNNGFHRTSIVLSGTCYGFALHPTLESCIVSAQDNQQESLLNSYQNFTNDTTPTTQIYKTKTYFNHIRYLADNLLLGLDNTGKIWSIFLPADSDNAECNKKRIGDDNSFLHITVDYNHKTMNGMFNNLALLSKNGDIFVTDLALKGQKISCFLHTTIVKASKVWRLMYHNDKIAVLYEKNDHPSVYNDITTKNAVKVETKKSDIYSPLIVWKSSNFAQYYLAKLLNIPLHTIRDKKREPLDIDKTLDVLIEDIKQ
jgi:hypothetical protein